MKKSEELHENRHTEAPEESEDVADDTVEPDTVSSEFKKHVRNRGTSKHCWYVD